MINNYAFNPNPRVHKPNLVKNGNSTGNVKIKKDTRETDNIKFYNKMDLYNGIGQAIDYRISNNNKVKKHVKSKKEG